MGMPNLPNEGLECIMWPVKDMVNMDVVQEDRKLTYGSKQTCSSGSNKKCRIFSLKVKVKKVLLGCRKFG